MAVVHAEMPLVSGPVLTAVPVPNNTGWVGSPAGASHTLNTGGKGWLFASMPGLVNASFVFTVAGDSVTVAVTVPPSIVAGVMVNRPPTPLLFGLLPPVHWLSLAHTLKLYLLIVKFAALVVIA